MTDPNFERSLRAAARRGRAGGVHPDASLLAAYVDRGLNDAERAELEMHVADCAECMERLALLGSVNVPDEPEAPALEWSPRQLLSRWGWLVPVATVVVLVAVWERQPAKAPNVPVNKEEAEKPAPPAASPAVPPLSNQPAETDEREGALTSANDSTAPKVLQKSPARQGAPATKAKDAFASAARAPEEARTLRDKKQIDAVGPVASNEVAITAPPAPVAAPAPAQEQSAAAAAVGGRADEAKRRSETALTIKGMPESIAQGALLKSEGEGPVVLASFDVMMIRRVGTHLERSTDRGATWTVDLPDAPPGLHSGSCPTTTVCWLGGAGGAVLLRHDSGTWTRHVVSDGRAGVIEIQAADALTATVRLADGRRFRTSDGGSTWELVGSKP